MLTTSTIAEHTLMHVFRVELHRRALVLAVGPLRNPVVSEATAPLSRQGRIALEAHGVLGGLDGLRPVPCFAYARRWRAARCNRSLRGRRAGAREKRFSGRARSCSCGPTKLAPGWGAWQRRKRFSRALTHRPGSAPTYDRRPRGRLPPPALAACQRPAQVSASWAAPPA